MKISSSGCTKVSEGSTPTEIHTNNVTPEEKGPPPLRRSTRSCAKLPTSKEPSRRKSTHNTVGSSRPPPLAISPLIKTEPVDVNEGVVSSEVGVVAVTFGMISGFTLTTPSEETEEDELKPSTLQPRELHTNELQPNEIRALNFKSNTDSTIHSPDNPSVYSDSTKHSPDNPSVSSDSTKQCRSTDSTELPSYETVRLTT